MDLKSHIREVPDFPKPGILFKDITPLLSDAKAFAHVISVMKERYSGEKIDKICGIESRGFMFAAPLAVAMGVGFVPVRKSGKLPWKKYSQEYSLEYGTDRVEIHTDAVSKGDRIVIVDDLLATGGTVGAVCALFQKLEAHVVSLAFLTELSFLAGREKLKGYDIFTLVKY